MINVTWSMIFGMYAEILTNPVTWFVAAIFTWGAVCEKLKEKGEL